MSGRPHQSLLEDWTLALLLKGCSVSKLAKGSQPEGKVTTRRQWVLWISQGSISRKQVSRESKDSSAPCTPNSNVNFSKNAVLTPPSLDQEHAPQRAPRWAVPTDKELEEVVNWKEGWAVAKHKLPTPTLTHFLFSPALVLLVNVCLLTCSFALRHGFKTYRLVGLNSYLPLPPGCRD